MSLSTTVVWGGFVGRELTALDKRSGFHCPLDSFHPAGNFTTCMYSLPVSLGELKITKSQTTHSSINVNNDFYHYLV